MAAAAESPEDLDSSRKRIVMVVEDEVTVRLLIAEHLGDVGFKVIEAADAGEAVSVFASQTAIDLVFTDANMPGQMDGIALAGWIATHHSHVPVLMTSGNRNVPAEARAHKSVNFIAKPYGFAEVEKRIRALLK